MITAKTIDRNASFRLNPLESNKDASGTYYRSIEELRGLVQDRSKITPQVIKSVAKEMESLFIYEMIKAMRSTIEKSSKSDFGSDVNTSMFDLEIARFLSQRGIGLQDILVKELSRKTQKTESLNQKTDNSSSLSDSRAQNTKMEVQKAKYEKSGNNYSSIKSVVRESNNPYLSLNHFPDLIALSTQKTKEENPGTYEPKARSENPYLALSHFPDLVTLKILKEVQKAKENEISDKESTLKLQEPSNSPPTLSDLGVQNSAVKLKKARQIEVDTLENNSKSHELDQTPATAPFLLPINGTISSHFGARLHPIYRDIRFHNGVDIVAPVGTEIRPIEKGKVIFSGKKPGYGNVVVIDHGNGFTSKYAHNKVNLVKEGDEVDPNTNIALLGNTGVATGPHLHFEIRHNGRSIDPIGFIKEFWKFSDKINVSSI
jgi:murein DD-endopeptidase MepM/ murein hydrolase activator NlpD